MEEIGTNNANLIYTSSQWLNYQIPEEILKTLPWGDRYIGQTQKWFVFQFTGKDYDINVSTTNPEFSEWKWEDHNALGKNIVPFKRNLYEKVLEEFKSIFNKT
jgi:putative (di)nucleoside polyphosphate hydrolase